MSVASAIQQARIEIVINRRCNTDAFEIRMLRIEKKICIGWAYGAWHGEHCGSAIVNPAVADLASFDRRGMDSPVGGQCFRRNNFCYDIWPFQAERFKFIDRKKWLVVYEDLDRCGGLMLARVNYADTWRVPSSPVAPGAFTCPVT